MSHLTRWTVRALLLCGLALAPAGPALAAGLSVEIINGYNLIQDSNVTAPSTYAPNAAFIGARVCNNSGGTLTNVFAYVGDGATPGIFPSRTFVGGDPQTQLIGTGSYALKLEAGDTGITDGTRYMGTLVNGECRIQYWLFSYPQCVNVAGAPDYPPCAVAITGDVQPINDPSLNYTVWASGSGGTSGTSTRAFTVRNEISAAANKIWPNTTSKVPDNYLAAIQAVIGWGTLGPDGRPLSSSDPVYPGQRLITTQGIWYDLGNVGQGFDNDGDLVPDQNAWLQPVGDPAAFDADCFRMVNVYGIVIVKLRTAGELLIPFQNELYFEHLPDNTGVVGLVFYQFVATDGVCSANMTPYQEAASGFDNEKFNADYGLNLPVLSRSFGAGLLFTKDDGVTQVTPPLSPLTYTLRAENKTDDDGNLQTGDPGTGADIGVHIGAPDLGMYLVFRETIPAGTTYLAGSAAAGLTPPSTGPVPPGGADGIFTQGYTDRDGNLDLCTIHYRISSSTYTILYSTNSGSTWVTTEPVPANTVTTIKWLLSTSLALDGGHNRTDCVSPNGIFDDGTPLTSLPFDTTSTNARKASVSFQVAVGLTAGPVLCNTAVLGFGEAISGTQAQDCDLVTGNNSLGGTVFEDDGGPAGSGATYGNGSIDNGTEVGIGGVVVALYYDVNGDGKKDSGDLFYGSTTTVAGSVGTYSFSLLPDGPFVVVVSKYNNSAGAGNDVNEMLAARCSPVGNCNDIAGWGNTTIDPNLPLSSAGDAAPWPLLLNEDLATATLAVNLDLAKDDAAVRAATGVNFGFAPPFRLTKNVTNNPDVAAPADVADTTIGEGDVFSYTILLENRLPSVGKQGPTGCEYTVWTAGPTGTTAPGGNSGTTGNKDFSNPGNAYDAPAPNRILATALNDGGANRWLYGHGFNLTQKAGAITKVEALYFGYYDRALTDDFLNVYVGLSTAVPDGFGIQNEPAARATAGAFSTASIDNYIGAPPDTDPNSAIAWDITSKRPNGFGAWAWADFPGLYLQVNPGKQAGSDFKTFSIDAVGLRVTTNAACEASASTTLSPVPLQDRYDIGRIAFVSADPTPISVDAATGVIQWANVGPIPPGSSKVVTVTARALNVSGLQAGSCPASPPTTQPAAQPWNNNCNYAQSTYSSSHVMYADGRQANDDYDKVAITLQGKAELRGVVWDDNNNNGILEASDNDGWPNTDPGEPGLPGVRVTLWGCWDTANGVMVTASGNNNFCANPGRTWRDMGTAVTDANGAYEFIGLNAGYYLVEVGNNDTVPGSGSVNPYGSTQTAEPNDTQVASGGNATGTNGVCAGGCNNTWGNLGAELLANQSTINLLNGASGVEEKVAGINFGYYIASAFIYGKVWHDVDGDAGPSPWTAAAIAEPGELGLAGFTVTLSGAGSGTTTTDASGNYGFGGLAPGTYTITVTPPTLRNQFWTETVESTGGTSSLTNSFSVTLTVGLSGSHDFGYTLKQTASIGDTVFLDFDGDGQQDATETGIPNITVWLYQDVDRDGTIDVGVDNLVATDVTDASGKYLFGPSETGAAQVNLSAGSYVVKVDTSDTDFPTDATPSVDSDVATGRIGDRVYLDAGANGPSTRTVVSATTNLSTTVTSAALFKPSDVGATISGAGIPAGATITGFASPSSITISAAVTATGTPTLDVGSDGDDGIPNVVVVLYEDTDNNGSLSYVLDKLVAATSTDVDGLYLFTGLHGGKYFVDVADDASEPNGNTLPRSSQSSQLALVGSDPKATLITLATNSSSVLTADAGYSLSATFALGNRVWSDADGDGSLDPGEAGLPGVTIRVTNAVAGGGTGCPVVTPCMATTDAAGFWMVTGLTAGNFLVDVVSTTTGILDSPRNFRVTAVAEPRTVAIGAADLMTVDFGFRYSTDNTNDHEAADPTGIIDGRVYLDGDANGAYSSGRTVVSATTNLSTTVTSAALFLITDVGSSISGTGIPSGAIITAFASSSSVTISAPATATGTPTLTLAKDTVRAGTTVNLLDENGYIVATTNTDSSGKYYFGGNSACTLTLPLPTTGCSGIFIGQYAVQAVDSLGTRFSTIFVSTATSFHDLDIIYSPPVETVADSLSGVSVDGVHADLMQDFGYTRFVGSIGDTVYWDVNENATQDLGEPGFPNVTVNLYVCGWTDAIVPSTGLADGMYETGEETGCVLASTKTTTADDPTTAADESGKYLFSGLATPVAGQYYIVRVDTSTIPGATKTLIGDPDTDGDPCPMLPIPDVIGDAYPPYEVCDSAQLIRPFRGGLNYLGADFGYQISPTAGYATIGDHLWIDIDGDGIVDVGEPGIRYVSVWLDTNNNGVLDWTDGSGGGVVNGRWDVGEGERWVQTDADGYYVFTQLVDATYNVRVLTSDADWPAGLPTVPTYEGRLSNTDRNNHVQMLVSGGAVTSLIDGDGGTTDACTGCNLNADFAYRYAGSNTLSGTICVDDAVGVGYCSGATTYTGVGVGESPIAGIQVFLYRWNDTDADNLAWAAGGVLDPGDTFTLLGSTATNGSGDYSFSNVPTGKLVIVSSIPDTQNLRLTTTNANSSVEWPAGTPQASTQLFEGISSYQGNTVTVLARQALNITPANNTVDVDFAFDATLGGTLSYDFGDLPDPQPGTPDYNASLLVNGGAQHKIISRSVVSATTIGSTTVTSAGLFQSSDVGSSISGVGIPAGATITAFASAFSITISAAATATGAPSLAIGSIMLGTTNTPEANGYNSPDAGMLSGTGDAGDDGVTLVGNQLTMGTGGGQVTVTVNGGATGWLAGWMDFDGDGSFGTAGEWIINQQAVSGPQTITFNVPGYLNGGLDGTNIPVFARFRIYPSQPLAVVSTGLALDSNFQPAAGEVEDYRFITSVTRVVIRSFVAREVDGAVALDWETSSEVGTVGFFLRRFDVETDAFVDVNARLLPSFVFARQGGMYRFIDPGARTGDSYQYELVEVEASGARNTHGPYSVNTNSSEYQDSQAQRWLKRLPALDANGYAKALHVIHRPNALRRRQAASKAQDAWQGLAPAVKIGVGASGVYYVPFSALLAQGHLDPNVLSSFHLTNRGQAVAYMLSPDRSGILFYGQALNSIFARDNVYWLEAGPGALIGTSTDHPPTSQYEASYKRHTHLEQDVYAANWVYSDPELDYWLWEYFSAGEAAKSFSFRTDGLLQGAAEAELAIELKGGTNTVADPDHHAVIRINGSEVAQLQWNGTETASTRVAFDASLLVDGGNVLEIEGLTDTAAPYSVFLLNHFDIYYPSRYRTGDNRLEFPAAGNAAITVSGFTRPDILVLQITNPQSPVLIPVQPQALPDGTIGFTLTPAQRRATYYAVAADAVRSATSIVPDRPSSLKSTSNAAEYLVVTTRATAEPAQRLAHLRADLGAQVVDLEDIYDEFNFGIPKPHALRDFLRFAYLKWSGPPRYVVLAGAGTFDYRDLMGEGDNLIPTMMTNMPGAGLFATDQWFADVAHGRAPEIALGRLPAVDSTELDQMIDKLEARASTASDAWVSRTLVVADNADDAGDFATESERIAALAPAGTAERIYIAALGAAEARMRLLDGINQGVGKISYIGHGGYDVLADEVLLSSQDVPGLSNDGRPTVLTAMTCLAGDFSVPGYPSVGTRLLRKPGGGAVAVFAPTGLSNNEYAALLAEQYYAIAFAGSEKRIGIGDAVVAAMKAYEQSGAPGYMLALYNLLGDPAMPLD